MATKAAAKYWASWFKNRTLVCKITRATNGRQHRQRSTTGDMLESYWKAINMTSIWGFEQHDEPQCDAKVRLQLEELAPQPAPMAVVFLETKITLWDFRGEITLTEQNSHGGFWDSVLAWWINCSWSLEVSHRNIFSCVVMVYSSSNCNVLFQAPPLS